MMAGKLFGWEKSIIVHEHISESFAWKNIQILENCCEKDLQTACSSL